MYSGCCELYHLIKKKTPPDDDWSCDFCLHATCMPINPFVFLEKGEGGGIESHRVRFENY